MALDVTSCIAFKLEPRIALTYLGTVIKCLLYVYLEISLTAQHLKIKRKKVKLDKGVGGKVGGGGGGGGMDIQDVKVKGLLRRS